MALPVTICLHASLVDIPECYMVFFWLASSNGYTYYDELASLSPETISGYSGLFSSVYHHHKFLCILSMVQYTILNKILSVSVCKNQAKWGKSEACMSKPYWSDNVISLYLKEKTII